MDKFYTVDEVAENLKVPIETVRVWLRKGTLKGVRLGRYWRIKETNLQEFINNQETKDGNS